MTSIPLKILIANSPAPFLILDVIFQQIVQFNRDLKTTVVDKGSVLSWLFVKELQLATVGTFPEISGRDTNLNIFNAEKFLLSRVRSFVGSQIQRTLTGYQLPPASMVSQLNTERSLC